MSGPGDRRGPCDHDPFDGLFDEGLPSIDEGSLLDIPNARKWFEVIAWGKGEELYTYQQPLDGASGPHVTIGGKPCLMLSSYDYLGLINHPSVVAGALRAIRRYGVGTGGVRLLTGTLEEHRELERTLARAVGTEAAMVFSSGFVANVSTIAALLGPGDSAVLDEDAHRSIVDGCRLAGARIHRFRHNDPGALERILRRPGTGARRLVAVDGVYSMDGDLCPLPEILAVARRHGAHVMVDEAHSFGVLGPEGRGITAHFGIDAGEIDLITGSLSKAVPSGGGFVAATRKTISFLQHGASAFFFSGALTPASAGAAIEALNVMRNEPGRFTRLWNNADRLRAGLVALGYDVGASCTPIIPVLTGSDERAYRLSRRLLDLSVVAMAVVAPAVRPGAARLRLCATAALSSEDIDTALSAFEAAAERS